MDRHKWRNVAAIWGSIALGVGILGTMLFGQVNAICGTTLIAASQQTYSDCFGFTAAYHLAQGLMVVGATLIVGAFILAASRPVDWRPKQKQIEPGWYQDPDADYRLRWWNGERMTDPTITR